MQKIDFYGYKNHKNKMPKFIKNISLRLLSASVVKENFNSDDISKVLPKHITSSVTSIDTCCTKQVSLPKSADLCAEAVMNGHLECLKYAHEHGCEWDSETCSIAAWKGHVDCLKYAREHGCEWDKYTTLNAARKGHLDCLKYAYENGCDRNPNICSIAADAGHFSCMKYACTC